MTHHHHRRAFSLLEVFVVLGIIAMFLALIVPFAIRMREGGRSAECVKNLQNIGKGILAYTNDNENRLPGPLDENQYPVVSAGDPPRDGQLLKYIERYLNAPANSEDGETTAKSTFVCPTWKKSEHATDAPVFLVNTTEVQPKGQPAWGADDKPPLTLDQLSEWKHSVSGTEEPVVLSEMWALTDADRGLTRILGIKDPWVEGIPLAPVHINVRNALYFDWHVEPLVLHRSIKRESNYDELQIQRQD